MDLTERAEIRKETFYKLTNSRDVPGVPANAHRNFAQTTSGSWSKPRTNFNGGINNCSELGKVLTDGMEVGDTVRTRIVLKYDNIIPAEGKTAKCWWQGAGNVTVWGSGAFPNTGGEKALKGSGEFVFEGTDTIHPNHLKNDYWSCSLRFDYITSGSVQWKEEKVEIGKNFTPYTPAPEQLGWSKIAPVPTPDQRYLWKFEYIYYSDDSVEITPPVNLSIAGGTVSHRETFYKLTNSADRPDRPTGTRNLLLYSGDPYAHRNEGYYSPFMASAATESVNGSVAYKTGPNEWARLGIDLGKQLVERRLVKAGDKLTYSVLAKTDQDTPIKITLFVRYKGSGSAEYVNGKPHEVTLNKNWQKISIPFTVTEKMVAETTRINYFAFEQMAVSESGKYVYYACNKIERGDTATPYNRAPEDYGWTIVPLVPTPDQRYLWKFEYIYYSDGNFEVTEPVNISIAGEYGKNSYIHTAYANITKLCNENQNFTVKASTVVRYGYGDKWVYKTFEAGTYAGNSATFGKDPYQGKAKQCDAITDFSLTDSTGRNWLGTYSDNSVNAVAHPSFFTWQLTKGQTGATGPQGIPGPPGEQGADGRTQYTHIAYADDATGSGFSQSSQGKTYIGMYQDFNPTNSSDPTKYRWSKWKGDQGLPGKPGADGKTSYFHMAYADSADGRIGFSFKESGQQYQGYYTDFVQANSTDPTKYTWMDRRAGVEFGGVNLLRNSKSFTGSNITGSGTLLSETYQGCAVRYFKNTNENSAGQEVVQFENCVYPKLGGEYVASFWAKGSGELSIFFHGGQKYLLDDLTISSWGESTTRYDGCVVLTLTEDWERYWIKYKLKTAPASATSVGKHLLFRHNNSSTEDEIYLAGVQLENGNVPTPYTRNPEDVQSDIDSKADQTLTQEQLNALAEKNRNMEAEMAAKASLAEVERWKQAYDEYVAQNDADKTSAEQKLITLTSRVAEWVKDWEDKKVQWSFLDTNMDFGEEGLRLGKKGSPTSILISNDRIGFYSGGSEVASMSNGTLTIDNGIFAKSLQIGHYREEVYEGDKNINVIRWVD